MVSDELFVGGIRFAVLKDLIVGGCSPRRGVGNELNI